MAGFFVSCWVSLVLGVRDELAAMPDAVHDLGFGMFGAELFLRLVGAASLRQHDLFQMCFVFHTPLFYQSHFFTFEFSKVQPLQTLVRISVSGGT